MCTDYTSSHSVVCTDYTSSHSVVCTDYTSSHSVVCTDYTSSHSVVCTDYTSSHSVVCTDYTSSHSVVCTDNNYTLLETSFASIHCLLSCLEHYVTACDTCTHVSVLCRFSVICYFMGCKSHDITSYFSCVCVCVCAEFHIGPSQKALLQSLLSSTAHSSEGK